MFCHSKHLQCDVTRPCKNCVKRNVADSCQDVQRKRSKTKSRVSKPLKRANNAKNDKSKGNSNAPKPTKLKQKSAGQKINAEENSSTSAETKETDSVPPISSTSSSPPPPPPSLAPVTIGGHFDGNSSKLSQTDTKHHLNSSYSNKNGQPNVSPQSSTLAYPNQIVSAQEYPLMVSKSSCQSPSISIPPQEYSVSPHNQTIQQLRLLQHQQTQHSEAIPASFNLQQQENDTNFSTSMPEPGINVSFLHNHALSNPEDYPLNSDNTFFLSPQSGGITSRLSVTNLLSPDLDKPNMMDPNINITDLNNANINMHNANHHILESHLSHQQQQQTQHPHQRQLQQPQLQHHNHHHHHHPSSEASVPLQSVGINKTNSQFSTTGTDTHLSHNDVHSIASNNKTEDESNSSNGGVINNLDAASFDFFDPDFTNNINGNNGGGSGGNEQDLEFNNLFYDGLNNQMIFRPFIKLGQDVDNNRELNDFSLYSGTPNDDTNTNSHATDTSVHNYESGGSHSSNGSMVTNNHQNIQTANNGQRGMLPFETMPKSSHTSSYDTHLGNQQQQHQQQHQHQHINQQQPYFSAPSYANATHSTSYEHKNHPQHYTHSAPRRKLTTQEYVNGFKRNNTYKSPLWIRKKVFQEIGDLYSKFPVFDLKRLFDLDEEDNNALHGNTFDHKNPYSDLKYIISILSFSYMKSYQELIKYFYDRLYIQITGPTGDNFGNDNGNGNTSAEESERTRNSKRKLFFKILEKIWVIHNYFRIQSALIQTDLTNLTNFSDNLLTELIFHRQLLNFENMMTNFTSTPAIIWRRSTEIVFISDELCVLIGIKNKAQFLSKRRFLCEIIDDMSILNYFKLFNSVVLRNDEITNYHNVHNRFHKLKNRFRPEEVDDLENELSDDRINNGSGIINGGMIRFNCKFINQNYKGSNTSITNASIATATATGGDGINAESSTNTSLEASKTNSVENFHAFESSFQKPYSQEINEEHEQLQKYIAASSILTIKRDMFDIPMLIVGQFLPILE